MYDGGFWRKCRSSYRIYQAGASSPLLNRWLAAAGPVDAGSTPVGQGSTGHESTPRYQAAALSFKLAMQCSLVCRITINRHVMYIG